MKIISYAQTTDALIKGLKSETRRCWTDDYARQFRIGDVCKAFDKNPRCGGKEIARVQILETPYRESIYEMTEADEVAEGGLWGSVEEFVRCFLENNGCDKPYVVKFRLVSVGGVSCIPDTEVDEVTMIGPVKTSKGQLKLFEKEKV